MSLRIAVAIASVGIGAFHARLFAGQLLGGDLTDLGRVVRWLIAAAITAVLIALVRRGESLAGRKAIAAWALAAVLHGPAVADTQGFNGVALLPESAIGLLQVTIAGATFGLLLFAAIARRARLRSIVAQALAGRSPRLRVAGAEFAPAFIPRPPPRA